MKSLILLLAAALSWTYPEVNLLIDEPETMNPALETEIIFFALPNGNTIEYTAGKRMAEGDDWRFDIQHITAQTKFLREEMKGSREKNYITVYLMAHQKSWNAWHKKHIDIAAETYESIFSSVLERYAPYNPTMTINSHSGGGYLIFNYFSTTDHINPAIKRLVFIDSCYGYDTDTHLEKFTEWLKDKSHYLTVISYEDATVIYDGKPLVTPGGGTWGRSHKMIDDLSQSFRFREQIKTLAGPKEVGKTVMEDFRADHGRICFKLLRNPKGEIYHTVMVEKNGFIDAVFVGTKGEGKGYTFWGERAYEKYIDGPAELKLLTPGLRNGKAEDAVDKFLEKTRTLPKAPDSIEVHSVMLMQHGKVLAGRWLNGGGPLIPHKMWSVSKTLTAMAAGLAISEGKLNLDDKVISFFPDKLPAEMSENLASMTVRDLMTMTCGQANEATAVRSGEEDWVQGFLAHPVPYKPGTWFAYNSLGTYMVSAIVQQVTGQKIVDYLDERVFQHIGVLKPVWEESPQGINCGGWGCNLTTLDMARIGQLLLDGGYWQGERGSYSATGGGNSPKQVLPSDWVSQMTSFKVPTARPSDSRPDWTQGYCYFMWECTHGGVRADGANGQYIILLPEKDAMIVLTSAATLYQPYLDIVWDELLPAFE